MALGGARPGAGRKPGQKSKKTLEREAIAAKNLDQGITPLEVMLKAMRLSVEKEEWREAAAYARDAAPYLHPKLSNVSMDAKLSGGIQISFVNEFE